MGILYSKEEKTSETEETYDTAPDNYNIDNTSEVKESDSNRGKTNTETEEKYESLKDEVDKQHNQENPTSNLKKSVENDEISNLTSKIKNVQIQEESSTLAPKIQAEVNQHKPIPNRRKPRILMQISATNRSTGVTKSIYGSEQLQQNENIELPTDIHVGNQQMHGNNNECSDCTCFENQPPQVSMQQFHQNKIIFHSKSDRNNEQSPEESKKPICNRNRNECSCLCEHQPGYLTTCICPCCTRPASDTYTPWGYRQNQVFSHYITKDITNTPNSDPIYYGEHESSPECPNIYPLAQNIVVDTFQQTANLQNVSQFYIQPVQPIQQNYYQPYAHHANSGYSDLGPLSDPGVINQGFNYDHPIRSIVNPDHLPTTKPIIQQQFFPLKEHQNHMLTNSNNHHHYHAPYNLPSTSNYQARRGRPRCVDEACDPKSIKAREYNEKRRNLLHFAEKIIANLNSFCEGDRYLVEKFMAEFGINKTNEK